MISHFKETFDEADELDGFEDLGAEDQARVRKAWAVGSGTLPLACQS